MPALTNTFKSRLRARQLQYGLWLAMADDTATEIAAGSGYDWLLLDGEHAPYALPSMLSALRTLAAYPVQPVVRVPVGDANLIKQVLELGAQTLLIPMVETAAQARALVAATRYPPAGIRGVGSGIARSSRWGGHGRYLHEANEQICLLLQVESETALASLEEIAAVEGVDGVFIGPADLSASMGYLGQADHPVVVAAIRQAIATLNSAGKAAGILCTNPALAREYIHCGVHFIAVGVDTSLLAQSCRNLIASFHTAAADDRPAVAIQSY